MLTRKLYVVMIVLANTRFSLGLTAQEKSDLVEYLKSLLSEE